MCADTEGDLKSASNNLNKTFDELTDATKRVSSEAARGTQTALELQKLFGYSGEAEKFFPKLAEFASSIGDSHILALLLGLSLLALLVILRQFAPELPAALVVVIVGIVAVATVLPSLAVFRRACLRRTSPLSNQVYSNRFSLTLRVSPWSVSPAGY